MTVSKENTKRKLFRGLLNDIVGKGSWVEPPAAAIGQIEDNILRQDQRRKPTKLRSALVASSVVLLVSAVMYAQGDRIVSFVSDAIKIVAGPPKYYRKAYLDDRYQVGGAYPLSEKEARKMDHYVFDYDEQERIIGVKRCASDLPYFLDCFEFFGFAKEVTVSYADGVTRFYYYDAKGNPTSRTSSDFSVGYEYDPQNMTVTICNYGEDGELSEDISKVLSYMVSLDEQGRRKRAVFLDKGGRRTKNRWGVYETRWEYDGTCVYESQHGLDGELMENSRKIKRVCRCYDEYHNLVEERYSDGNARPFECPYWGMAMTRYKYDDYGFEVEKRFLGADGKLKERKDNGVAYIVKEYIERNSMRDFIFEEKRYGINGELKESRGKINADGLARIVYIQSEKDRTAEIRHFGADGKLKRGKDPSGFTVQKRVYDDDWSIIEMYWIDAEGEPEGVRFPYFADGRLDYVEGVFRIVSKYDDAGNATETIGYDAEGNEVYKKTPTGHVSMK